MEQKPTPHDGQYFVMGNNKIIISEHFRQDGKPLISILEKDSLPKISVNIQHHPLESQS